MKINQIQTTDKLYVIVDSKGNFVKFGSKIAWTTQAAAKNAFAFHVFEYPDGKQTTVRIDTTDYKVVKILKENI